MRHLPLVALFAAACGQDYNVLQQPDVDPADVTPCPFSPISGTRFSRYDCNPVFTSTGEDWVDGGVGAVGYHAEEVLGHPFYQMWYSADRSDGRWGLGYAISPDGTNWTALADNPVVVNPTQGWNRDAMGAVQVVWQGDAQRYVLAYQGVNLETDGNGLGLLASSDGQVWEQLNDGKPFLQLSQVVDGVRYCWPLALTWTADVGFRGYINGGKGLNSDLCEVYTYGGSDIGSIEPDNAKPILPAGPKAYDRKGASSAAVVKFGETWYMFYAGIRDWQPIQDGWVAPYDTTLNLATSPDGLHWEKSPDNPIDAVALKHRPSVIGNISAQVVGSRIHLWIDDDYDDVGQAVGYFLYEPDIEPFE
ncbi:MAG: hypothetical protein R3F59_20155 [Myxococcota bacterium]